MERFINFLDNIEWDFVVIPACIIGGIVWGIINPEKLSHTEMIERSANISM